MFEARLSGYCVREGGVKGVNPGFLVLAFSARTLKSNGVPARGVPAGGMLPLVCSTPACAGLLVVVRFSCVHRCCFLGCCFHLSKDPLGVKLSPVLACSTSGSGRGFRSRLLARVLPGVGAGSEARGEGRLFLRMRLRLLYSVCVVICWGRARRAPRSGPSSDDRWFLRRYQGGSCSCS